MRSNPPDTLPRHHRIINRAALLLAVFFAGFGVLRLVNVLLLNEVVNPLPLDGWLAMSLRGIAFLFALGMLLFSKLRRQYWLILLSLTTLTSAGLLLRMANWLPQNWHPTAGISQLLLTIIGLSLLAAGLIMGENLAGFVEVTWMNSSRAAAKSWFTRRSDDSSQKGSDPEPPENPRK
jgi:hypothetical protein